jgi:outer membrane cobalamin receptor
MQRAWFQYIVGSFLAGLVIQGFPVSVLAQSQGSEAAPTALQPIVTTATRSERSLADLPVSVAVLDREQIQTAPAHATVTLRGRYQASQFNEAPNINKFGEHFVLDLYASCRVNQHVEVFLLGENLPDRQYLGTFFDGGQLAAPFQIFGGVRLAAF